MDFRAPLPKGGLARVPESEGRATAAIVACFAAALLALLITWDYTVASLPEKENGFGRSPGFVREDGGALLLALAFGLVFRLPDRLVTSRISDDDRVGAPEGRFNAASFLSMRDFSKRNFSSSSPALLLEGEGGGMRTFALSALPSFAISQAFLTISQLSARDPHSPCKSPRERELSPIQRDFWMFADGSRWLSSDYPSRPYKGL